ncbi:ABC transporter permease [Pseudoalteromonas luteoviolacea]|uniref:MacB-like periplasmic core domain-containing protein n=1 Tax=Pseudoalteromonas luteoviolacea S4054 TaxID=1129367 RepID=A0A0F6A5A0_9GAMM|nr:ABC transporter permease [Pseudoalteromonas luteoviolacea]AOT09125.1 hypothetical protein S4054249_15260 [Pseudoalteromonas luteoviolacea]AOT14038.1 hypothetical protein S40542_15230 [Pseudoalteromonas luteoviolacea]AOT18953.1 hypothetical protein S4054_15235 [Pseudoalteromonas luteoviolacea]KKE81021.1 hypothetical protein N479_23860 [Pseudoalteromonas luteoviolacea S4054]KZN70293.1 hypothetical protein N481_02130 [Pseudoalteromonas luteoviolacea S4047-1]
MKDALHLAWQGFRQKSKLTTLMIVNLVIGITLLLTMSTIIDQSGRSAISHKLNVLHHLSLNYMDGDFDRRHALRTPPMTYRDAQALSTAYKQQAVSLKSLSFNYTTSFVLDLDDNSARPLDATGSAVDYHFFEMIHAPFLFGTAWHEDMNEAAVIVLEKKANDHLFAGQNSVGQFVVINNQQLEVIGVVDLSHHTYRFQNNSFSNRENDLAFIPLEYAMANNLPRAGYMPCMTKEEPLRTEFRQSNMAGLKNAECGFLHAWAEVSAVHAQQQLDELTLWLRNYTQQQASQGRFPHSEPYYVQSLKLLHDTIYNFMDWERVYLNFAYLLFAITLVNTVGILLAKNQHRAKLVSLYRALGANRLYIIKLQVIELLIGATIAIALGLLGAQLGLYIMYLLAMYSMDYVGVADQVQRLYSMDIWFAGKAALSIYATILIAGLFPIVSASRIAPASQLRG